MFDDIVPTSRGNIAKFQDRNGVFIASLETEMFRARRYKRPLSIICMNVLPITKASASANQSRQLYFENKLRRFAGSVLRVPDFWGRVDRESFVIVCPETPREGIERAAERLRSTAEFRSLITKDRWKICIGVAEFTEETKGVEDFVAAAQATVVWVSEESPDLSF